MRLVAWATHIRALGGVHRSGLVLRSRLHGGQQLPVRLIGRLISNARVLALRVVPVKVLSNINSRKAYRVVRTKLHALVLHAPPEPLDKHVAPSYAPTVHRELAASFKHGIGELARSELTALIGVDDFRRAELRKRLLNNLNGVTRFKCGGRLVREHPLAGHIDHSGQIDEAFLHRDEGGVERLDLVGARDGSVAQQVRVDRVSGAGFAGAGLGG